MNIGVFAGVIVVIALAVWYVISQNNKAKKE